MRGLSYPTPQQWAQIHIPELRVAAFILVVFVTLQSRFIEHFANLMHTVRRRSVPTATEQGIDAVFHRICAARDLELFLYQPQIDCEV